MHLTENAHPSEMYAWMCVCVLGASKFLYLAIGCATFDAAGAAGTRERFTALLDCQESHRTLHFYWRITLHRVRDVVVVGVVVLALSPRSTVFFLSSLS